MILEALLGGGATGLLGSTLGKGLALLEAHQEHKRSMERNAFDRETELQIARIEAESAARTGRFEMERELAVVAGDVQRASYAHDAALGTGSRWVENARILVRPILTLLIILTFIWVVLAGLFGATDTLDVEALQQGLLSLTGLIVGWWFGDRAPFSRNRR